MLESQLQIVECTGYTKEEAFASLDFQPDHPALAGCNATQAWSKAGKPVPGSQAFKRFMIQQVHEKTKAVPGFGVYVVLDPPFPDTKKRPYTFVNNKTEGTREWRYAYMIIEAELSKHEIPNIEKDIDGNDVKGPSDWDVTVLNEKAIAGMAYSKSEAIQKSKELTTATHKDYILRAIKVPDLAPIAGYSIYTPSAGTKKGTWIVAGYKAE